MAASAFAGTGVVQVADAGSTLFSDAVQASFPMNNGYSLVQGSDNKFSIELASATVFGPVTGAVLQQLWQDLSQVGFSL